MCQLSITNHPECHHTYYTLEYDCGSSTGSGPQTCVQFTAYPVSRWSSKKSYIRTVPGLCGTCSGVGDPSNVLARVPLPRTLPRPTSPPSSPGRPDTGLSMYSIDSACSVATNSSFRMEGLQNSVSSGIKTRHKTVSNNTGHNRRATISCDRFVRPEMEWLRRTETLRESSQTPTPRHSQSQEDFSGLGCWIL